jgi:hypothetical protein
MWCRKDTHPSNNILSCFMSERGDTAIQLERNAGWQKHCRNQFSLPAAV